MKSKIEDERRECLGRVSLWMAAMWRCGEVLGVAIRARDDWQRRRLASQPLNPDGSPDLLTPSAGKQSFPTWEESRQIAGSLPEYAAVLFCQFAANGKSDKGAVAANGDPLSNAARKNIISLAFGTTARSERYVELMRIIEKARNEMIAHAQGGAFRLSHGPGARVSWQPTPELPDLEEWRDYATTLHIACLMEHGRLTAMKRAGR